MEMSTQGIENQIFLHLCVAFIWDKIHLVWRISWRFKLAIIFVPTSQKVKQDYVPFVGMTAASKQPLNI